MGLVMIMQKVKPEGIRKLREFMRLIGVFVLSDSVSGVARQQWIQKGYEENS